MNGAADFAQALAPASLELFAGPEPRAGSRARLSVRRLSLTEFRNYASLRLELDGRPVVLAGDNGAGKTNILEAVSFLSPGRGLRRARLDQVQRGAEADGAATASGWAVAARLDTPAGLLAIGTGLETTPASPTGDGGLRRAVRIDGKAAASQSALADHVAAVWLTPQQDRLFLDGPGGRRRFLDRMVAAFQPAHASESAAYENAMRQRLRLLTGGGGEPDWLAALEDAMARHGVAIAAARLDLTARLDHAARLGVGPFPRAALAMAGEVDGWVARLPALEAEDLLRKRLAESRRIDAEAGTTTIGPHRSDLAVRHLDRDIPAGEGSTGEQKAVLVAIVLAHARLAAAQRGRPPLLLLDEIAAHLDRRRRDALYEELLALGAQAWLTGVEAEAFAPLAGAAQFFRVAAGDVRAT